MDTAFKVKVSEGSKCQCEMVCTKLPNILLPNLVLQCIILSQCHAKRLVCYFQGQGHSKGFYDKFSPVVILCG